MAEKVIIDIELKGFDKAQKGLDDLTKAQIEQQDAIKDTKDEIKAYEKELALFAKARELGADLTDEQIKKEKELTNSIKNSKVELAGQKDQLSKTNTERRAAVKEVQNFKTATDGSLGSNERLKAQLAVLTKQYNTLSQEERENTEAGEEMGKNILDLTEKLKENESAVGDNRRNVGNYSESIREAFGNTEIFGVSLNGLRDSYQATKDTTTGLIENLVVTDSVIKSQEASTKGMTAAQKALNVATIAGKVAMNVFKLALIATGIGAFVVAIGSLVAFFTQTQKGAEVLRKVMSGLGATMDVLTDRLSSFGGGIAKIFSGDFSGGFEDMQESFKGIGDEIQREVELVTELENKLIALEKREIAASVARSEVNKQIKEQNRLAEDTNQSLEVRLAAANKVLDLEKEQIKIENDLANQQLLNALQLEGTYEDNIDNINAVKQAFIDSQDDVEIFNELLNIGISETTVEDVQGIADAIISNNNAIAASEEVLTTAQNKRNIIQQAIATGQEKAITDSQTASDEKAVQDEERLAKLDEILRTEKETLDFEKKKLLEELGLSDKAKELTQKEADAKKAIIDKYNQDVAELEQNAIKESQELALKAVEERIKNEEDAAALLSLEKEKEFLKQLNAAQGNEEEQQRLTKERNLARLEEAKTLAQQLEQILLQSTSDLEASADGGIADAILSEDMLADLRKRLLEAGVEIEKINKIIGDVGQDEEGNTLGDKLDLDEEKTEKIISSFSFAIGAIDQILAIASQNLQTRTDERIAAIDKQVESGVISEEAAEKQKTKVRKQAFKQQKKMDIASATMSYFEGLIQAFAQALRLGPVAGPIVGAINAGILTGTYSANIQQIKAQKFAEGGVIQGNSHAQGGVPFTVAGRGGFEAEGGEFIHKTKAVEHYGLPFMNALNNLQLPKMFAEGGYVAPVTASSISQQVSDGVSELVSVNENRGVQVVNVEQDFSNLQNKVNNVESARTY